jgi:hypothetical protein
MSLSKVCASCSAYWRRKIPKIGSIKVENLIDSTIVKKIEDSGFFDKMNAEYGGR